jgi:hypothetical protein
MDGSYRGQLDEDIQSHKGWEQLEEFGALINNRALERHELVTFLASTGCFFKEIPGGIVALALRITDDAAYGEDDDHDHFGAVERGAKILYAAVDEYGVDTSLQSFQPSHHQLFLDMVNRMGITKAELFDKANIIEEAWPLRQLTYDGYRTKSVAYGAGFHYGSERSSDREFVLCYEGLNKHIDAYTLPGDEAGEGDLGLLNFYYIHTLVEPMHGSSSWDAVQFYSKTDADIQQAHQGAMDWMEYYGNFWASLTRKFS